MARRSREREERVKRFLEVRNNEGRKFSVEESRRGGLAGGKTISERSAARRNEFVRLIEEGFTIVEACSRVGVTRNAYSQWRKRYPEFLAQINHARENLKANYEDWQKATEGADWSFIAWRKKFLETDTTWFQAAIVDALENAPAGEITLVLFPPEHGKTTVIEDWITYKFCMDKSVRITYGSETQTHSRKALLRIRNRLEPDSMYPTMISKFGPFAPPPRNDSHKGGQPWGQDYFDIRGKSDSDERDFSFTALGFGSQIAGTRCDLLVGDDLISMRNVGQSPKLLETFRQDWLSRPGTKGATVLIGTRVADGDLYDMLINEGVVDHLVKFKAHDPLRIQTHGTPWLWPERYSEDEYTRMRRNVGESAWQRNYQQTPRLAGDSTFSPDMIDRASDPLRSVTHPAPEPAVGLVMGLDPGYGTNAIVSVACNDTDLWVLGGRVDLGLTNSAQIFARCEAQAVEHIGRKLPWLHLTVEDKAFQKGLLDDAALHDLKARYGITARGHTTGRDKYDPVIGIPAMARDFNRGVIHLPGADDEDTKRFMGTFTEELMSWRPNMKGTLLKQDTVMAFWFAWLWWQVHRETIAVRAHGTTPTTGGLPWKPLGIGGLTTLN